MFVCAFVDLQRNDPRSAEPLIWVSGPPGGCQGGDPHRRHHGILHKQRQRGQRALMANEVGIEKNSNAFGQRKLFRTFFDSVTDFNLLKIIDTQIC